MMTRAELLKMYRIALRTREWAEKLAKRKDLAEDLCGLCAIASGHLHRELRNEGYRSVLATHDNHCFVLLNGYVVDVTASQFEGYERKRVVLQPLRKLRQKHATDAWWAPKWDIVHTSTTRRGMRKYQVDQGWNPNEAVAPGTIAGA